MKYKNENLKKFIDYYYQCEGLYLPPRKALAEKIGITESQIRTLITVFEKCNYIYNTGKGYKIFQIKKNFTMFEKMEDKGNYLSFSTKDYKITLNKFEIDILEPKIKFRTLEDLIYILFLFNIELNVTVHPIFYIKNSECWFRKECQYFDSANIVFMCEFTEHSSTLALTDRSFNSNN